MHELVITDATVVDGTGRPSYHAELAVDGGRVSELGRDVGAGRRTIDAGGRVVAPGFVDVHTHYDVQAFWDPTLSPTPLHGVTSVVAGNCGFSVAPLRPAVADYLMRMLARVEDMPLESLTCALGWDWGTTGEYLARLDGTLAVNTGHYVGHSAVRAVVMGEDANRRPATAAEIEQMAALVADALRSGALGFSSNDSTTDTDADGQPVPSRHATREEFVALCAVCARFPGTSLEFLPAPIGPFAPGRVELMAAMSAAAARPLVWNVMFPEASNLDECREKLAQTAGAASAGGRLLALAINGRTSPPMRFRALNLLPALQGPLSLADDELLALLNDPRARARIRADLEATPPFFAYMSDWSILEVVQTFSPAADWAAGRKVAELAAERQTTAFDVVCDVVVADRLRSVLRFDRAPDTHEDWAARVEVWRSPGALVGGSDAGAHLTRNVGFSYPSQILEHAVRREGLLGLEEAVNLLAARPADALGLVDRGRIFPGAFADLVVFDPSTVGAEPARIADDLPGGASRLYAGAHGVGHVLVAGREIVCDGAFTGSFPGRVLRSGTDTATA